MTHLVIQQKNTSEGGSVEIVTGAIIAALYRLSKDENLVYDPDDLKGDLLTPGTYLRYVNELHAQYPNLNITALNWYLYFTDPVIESYWANSLYGDGIGITTVSALSVNLWPQRDTVENNGISSSIKADGKFAFLNDSTIQSFNELGLFTRITNIPSACFYGSSLELIDLSNITTIGRAAFKNSNLSGIINIPNILNFLNRDYVVSTYNDEDGYFYGTLITECHLGSNISEQLKITTLKSYTFCNCTSLEAVTGLSNIISIDKYCFRNTQIKNLPDLNPNITEIKEQGLRQATQLLCINLTNCNIIKEYALSLCTNLIALDTNDLSEIATNNEYTLNATSIGRNAFGNCLLTNKTIICPNITGLSNTVFQATNIKIFKAPLATTIGDRSFGQCKNLTTIEVGTLTSIDQFAFEGCSSLTTIKSGNSINDFPTLTYIGGGAFWRERMPSFSFSSSTLSFPNLTHLGSSAFIGCTEITSVTNLGSITEILDATFSNCTNLTSVTFPSTLTSINILAFRKTGILELIIPEGVITVNGSGSSNSVFTNMKYIEVPSTCTTFNTFFHNTATLGTSIILVIKAVNPPTTSYYQNSELGITNGASRFSGIYVPDSSLSAYQNETSGVWRNTTLLSKIKPISLLQTDDPTYWAVYQSGLSSN